jgi:hypothetical protein
VVPEAVCSSGSSLSSNWSSPNRSSDSCSNGALGRAAAAGGDGEAAAEAASSFSAANSKSGSLTPSRVSGSISSSGSAAPAFREPV